MQGSGIKGFAIPTLVPAQGRQSIHEASTDTSLRLGVERIRVPTSSSTASIGCSTLPQSMPMPLRRTLV